MKRITIEGLEGKTLEVANAFNSALDKIVELEAKQVAFDDTEIKKEIAEVKDLAKGTKFEVKLEEMENDFAKRLNDIEAKAGKMESKNDILVSPAQAVLDTLAELKVNSFADLAEKKELVKGLEIKANITTASVTGDVSRTQEVSAVKFPRLRPLAFIGNTYTGFVSGAKSILMWTPGSYTANTGYAGEGANTVTENAATAEEKYRQMAKISAKQYITAETFEDLPQFAMKLQDQLTMNAQLFADTEILSGDGNDSTQKKHFYGIIGQGSTAFDGVSAATVVNANIADLVDACNTQAEIANYMTNTVWMHPSLANKLRRTKDSTGQYIVNQLITGEEVMGGLRVIRTTALTDNQLLVADAAMIQIWIKRNLELKVLQAGTTDVENDRYTAILFMRAQCLVEDEDKKAVVYVSDVTAALAAISA